MATCLVLAKYTQQGIQNIKERPQRADRLRARCKQHGCELKAGYLAMGRCDTVLLIEAPSDEAIAAVMLGASMAGSVSTETLRLFDEAETNAIVAAL